MTNLTVVKYGRTTTTQPKPGKHKKVFNLVAINVCVDGVPVKRYIAEGQNSRQVCEAKLVSELIDAINATTNGSVPVEVIELQEPDHQHESLLQTR